MKEHQLRKKDLLGLRVVLCIEKVYIKKADKRMQAEMSHFNNFRAVSEYLYAYWLFKQEN